MSTFGVVIDKAMIANALQTDARETGELLGFPMLLHVLWAGVIPAVLVARVQIVSSNSSRLKIVLGRILRVFAAIPLLLLMVADSYKDLSPRGLTTREVRVYAKHSHPLQSVIA